MNYKQEAQRIFESKDATTQIFNLLVARHELMRTRAEDQAKARVEGFKDGEGSIIGQLRGQKLEVEVSDDEYFNMPGAVD